MKSHSSDRCIKSSVDCAVTFKGCSDGWLPQIEARDGDGVQRLPPQHLHQAARRGRHPHLPDRAEASALRHVVSPGLHACDQRQG